jgi:hypothetical protein
MQVPLTSNLAEPPSTGAKTKPRTAAHVLRLQKGRCCLADKFIHTVVCVVSFKTWVLNLFRVMGGVTAVVFLWAKVSKQTGVTGKCHFSMMKTT